MCKVDGIEVTREELPAWDAAVASFQRNLRRHLLLIRIAADVRAERQLADSNSGLTATGS